MYSGWDITVHLTLVGCKGQERGVGLLSRRKHIAHEVAMYCNTPINSFTGGRKKLPGP
jgi:hypothetical protein